MKPIVTILLLFMLFPAASALTPTNEISGTILNIQQCPESVAVGKYTLVVGQLTYADGTELNIKHMDRIFIDIYVNGFKTYGLTLCNATGGFHAYLAPSYLNTGRNEIKCVFKGREYYGLLPSESEVHIVYVNEYPGYDHDNTRPLKLIGYAKGFFAFSWFSMLFVTIAIGCVSAHSDNPQYKAKSQDKIFFLGKILLTVTVLFLAVLFFVP